MNNPSRIPFLRSRFSGILERSRLRSRFRSRPKGKRMRKEDIVGVYRQTGEEAVSADGAVTAGEAKNSQIMYSADGYMSVLSGPAVRKPFAENESRVDLNG